MTKTNAGDNSFVCTKVTALNTVEKALVANMSSTTLRSRWALKQSRLELAREGIKKEKEAQQHDPRPFCGSGLLVAQIVLAETELQIVGGRHEQDDATSNHQSDKIIVDGVCVKNKKVF